MADLAGPPPPPGQSFASDNTAPAHPLVLGALQEANRGAAMPYGEDPWTERATQRFRELFDCDLEVFYTYGGTGANVVALQSLLAPYEAVVCTSNAHINVDECGAPERFAGAKLVDFPAPDGKLRVEHLRTAALPGHGEHNVRARVAAISQCTELGTVYSVDEVGELAEAAHALGMVLYVDGARIANAVVSNGCSLRQLTTGAGADVVTFGGTKNGLMYGEALVYLRPELAARARFSRKQAGQLASKMRFIAAQFDALLAHDLWLHNASHANEMASRLEKSVAHLPHAQIVQPVSANSIFARIAPALARDLQEWSFFWDWPGEPGSVRWMTSFATSEDDVDKFSNGVSYFSERYQLGLLTAAIPPPTPGA